jgi:hypothetical protein
MTMTELSDITFQGVAPAPQWPSRKTVIRWIGELQPWTLDDGTAYNTRTDVKNARNIPPASYGHIGHRRNAVARGLALQGKPWEAAMVDALGYQLFGDHLRFFWHHQFRILFPDHPQPLRMMNWTAMTKTMAMAFVLGWTSQATHQGYLTHAAIHRTYQLQLSYEQMHRRGHAFMLRLFAAWQGIEGHNWPAYAYDEPIYEGILERWNVPDPAVLEPWLIAACDRHTHEARPDTEKVFYDFSDALREPLEILLLFRLRELIGLTNPVLNHPLMEEPFDRLPSVQPSYVPDELVQGTLRRVREDWPEFDRVVSLDAIRDG